MQPFQNILVGIDLVRFNPPDGSGPGPNVLEPIHWSIRLAKLNSARLLFFAATNLSEDALTMLAEEDRSAVLESIVRGGGKVLEDLVQKARQEGVEAQCKLASGKGWLTIIQQVLRDGHDLVVVGTRGEANLGHRMFGSTSMKLLRRCPCPVLVAKPSTFASGILGAKVHRGGGTMSSPLNILVATNLQPPSEQALQLGVSLALQMNGQLHVLHVVEYELHEVCNIGLPDAKQERYRSKVRENAEAALQAQLEKTDFKELGPRFQIHLAGDVGLPDEAIVRFIEAHQIHLLVMGTIGRGGIRGIMIGNTAERLLPEVHCSVLAVKPPDFVCPIDS